MARPRSKPTPIGDALGEYLERAGLGGVAASSSLMAGWAELVGPGIAAHSSPQAVRGGRLTITVDSSAWMNQLSLLSTELLAKINAGTEGGAVTELRFRVGRLPSAGKSSGGRKATGQRPPRRRPSPAELEEIERAAAGIPDPELRASAIRLMTAAASVRR